MNADQSHHVPLAIVLPKVTFNPVINSFFLFVKDLKLENFGKYVDLNSNVLSLGIKIKDSTNSWTYWPIGFNDYFYGIMGWEDVNTLYFCDENSHVALPHLDGACLMACVELFNINQ